MTAGPGLRVVSAPAPAASRPTAIERARPDQVQRAAIRAILTSCPGLAEHDELALVFTRARRTEAAWLCAFARAAGVRVDLVPAQASRRDVERLVAGATARSLIVLADLTLELPSRAMQLPGPSSVNVIDVFQPPDLVAAQVERAMAGLGSELDVTTAGGARLRATTVSAGPGDPFGCLDVVVSAAQGTFVADGAIEVNRDVGWDCRLAGRPVTLAIEQGRVVDVSCDDAVIARFLTRAITVHRASRLRRLRFGLRRLPGGFEPTAGPVNRCRPGVTVCLDVAPEDCYNVASGDLRVDLTSHQEVPR